MKVHIFSIEPIETRYTGQWHTHIPKLFKDAGFEVNQIDGDAVSTETSPGAFLDFTNTNLWKSTQLSKFIEQVNSGEVGDDDHILITDAWNPCVTQLKYIKELLDKNWIIHGIWHAGSWDKEDFIGRVENNRWIRNLEKSMYLCYDHNYFATDFHINIFATNLFGPWYDNENVWRGREYTKAGWIEDEINNKKIVRTGFPFEYLEKIIKRDKVKGIMKINSIVFPHRLAPEKQLDIFTDLSKELPQYHWVVCQNEKRTKQKYHEMLQYSKIVFSANNQETLGISTCAEGPIADCIPLAPNRLSYTEIFKNHPKLTYPSEWTTNWDAYTKNKEKLKERIIDIMENYDSYLTETKDYLKTVEPKFFSATTMMDIFNAYKDNQTD